MKALSVRQPWADLIASGKKTIEVRSWPTKYRGPLVICSTKVGKVPGTTRCLVDLVECRGLRGGDAKAACCPTDLGGYAWVLVNVRESIQLPVKGRLGIFNL
jgi:hypothetical protein